ncbi:MAG TPA: choice-of-anchor D domain-containing protein [Terriglobales bacterium]|nr:choice-of-anchor D domain-containing protein [Terriglobales bacterium]
MRVGRSGFAVCFCLVSCATIAFGSNPNAVTSYIQETSNNTSACSSSSDPAGVQSYCTAAFNGFKTNPNDAGAETLVPVPSPGHVSNLPIKQLLYPGWNGKVLCEYQPWFGASNHKSNGYNENSAATVGAQDSFMLAVGCDVNLIDFYGSLDPGQSFNLATTSAVFSDLDNRSGFPLKFGIMEDKGALSYSCPTSGQAEATTVTCLENALISDMDYVNSHYANSGAYFTDGGDPVIFSFITQSLWTMLTGPDWNTIWTAVKAHTDSYSAPFKYIFEYGSFTSAPYDNGEYAWMQPPAYNASEQFWWGSITNLSPTYLDNFYSAGIAHPSQITVGGLWKGFDDNNASWSGNRVIAQQCGQVLLDTANEIAKYFGTSNQLPYVQIATWNDYEEGTEVETGIDNCYTVNASISGTQLSWSLVASDTYASPATVHHFDVYYADAAGNFYSAASNVTATTNTLDLSSLPSGTWSVYVEMVGKPLIINRVSNAVTFNNGPPSATLSPASLNLSTQTVGTNSAGQAVTLTNNGTNALAIYGIKATGDFLETNNCPTSLAAGSKCSIAVVFSPSASGVRSGSLQVTDSGGSVPQTASLSGTGVSSTLAFSPATVSFSSQALGTTSSAQTITVTNASGAAVTISGVSGSNGFTVANSTCSGSLAAGASCSFALTFSPTSAGAQNGLVTVSSSAQGTNALSLAGSGADFSVSAAPASQSVSAGTAADYTLTLASVGAAFGNSINLTCAGLPADSTCAFQQTSFAADASTTLVISTKAAQSALLRRGTTARNSPVLTATLTFSSFGLVGLLLVGTRRQKRLLTGALTLLGLVVICGLASSCGGASSGQPNNSSIPGTPTGSYNVTVTASSGSLTHTTTLTLVVK